MITIAEIQALLAAAEHPNADCTGNSAKWCPICGDCTCGPRYEGDPDGERTLNDDGCPLHAPSSHHAMGDAEGLREAVVDVARFAVALAGAVLAERETRKREVTIANEPRGRREYAEWQGAYADAMTERDTARDAVDALLMGCQS